MESKAVHILGSKKFNITMEVWDSLDALNLAIQHQTLNVYVVNTSMTLEFKDYINAGFEYSIDYGDGGGISSNGTDILYGPYNLSQFQHVYTQADVYIVHGQQRMDITTEMLTLKLLYKISYRIFRYIVLHCLLIACVCFVFCFILHFYNVPLNNMTFWCPYHHSQYCNYLCTLIMFPQRSKYWLK